LSNKKTSPDREIKDAYTTPEPKTSNIEFNDDFSFSNFIELSYKLRNDLKETSTSV
jgi:hypothetical protein